MCEANDSYNFGSGGASTLADNYGNSYSIDETQTATLVHSHVMAEIGHALATSAGSGFTVTYTPNNAGNLSLTCTEYSFAGSLSVDNSGGSTGTGTAISSGSFTTTGAADLLVGSAATHATGVIWTLGSGFSTLSSATGSSTAVAQLAEDNLSVSAGSNSVTATSSVSDAWACVGVAYLAQAVGMSASEGHDVFAASGGFLDPGSIAKTEGHDTFAAAAVFTSPASLAKTEGHDTFAASGHFLGAGSLSPTEGHDTFAAAGAFATSASLAKTEAHDIFSGAGIGPAVTLAAMGGNDAFAAAGVFTSPASLSPTEGHDTMLGWANVSPKIQATEAHDIFAGSATAVTGPAASMTVTEGHDTFAASGGFTYDARATFNPIESGDVFVSAGTESSSAAFAPTERHDVFAAIVAIANVGSMTVTEAGDVFHGGFERVAYNVYANTGHGDPINYGSVVDTTMGLTYTTSPLSYPGIYSFGVRAHYVISGLEEKNLDCEITVDLGPAGTDITNQPAPPTALRAFALAGGAIRVEWLYPPTTGPTSPTGFHVYIGTGSPNYASPVATVAYATQIRNSLVANITGYSNGVAYTVGVRAYNAISEETNTNTTTVTAIAAGPAPVDSLVGYATGQS